MFLSELLYCVVVPAMTVHCQISASNSTPCHPQANDSSDHTKQPEGNSSLADNIRHWTKRIKARQGRRKTVAGNSNATQRRQSGLTTRKQTPHMRRAHPTPDPSVEFDMATSDILGMLMNF